MGANVVGGQQLCKSCTLRECIRQCNFLSMDQCKAVDYDKDENKCYRQVVSKATKMTIIIHMQCNKWPVHVLNRFQWHSMYPMYPSMNPKWLRYCFRVLFFYTVMHDSHYCCRHNSTTVCASPRVYKSVTHFTKNRCGMFRNQTYNCF